jgi:hypothetical protein
MVHHKLRDGLTNELGPRNMFALLKLAKCG